jgi:hypothetical protein
MALHLSKLGRACWRYPWRLMALLRYADGRGECLFIEADRK